MKKLTSIILILLIMSSFLPSHVKGSDDFIVVIDAGHGGFDPGAVAGPNKDIYEKTFNQKIVNYIRENLEKYEGVKIYVTSINDNYLSISGRVDFAAYFNADLFLSVHNNAGPSTATGSTAFIPSGNFRPEIAKEAKEIADLTLSKVSKATGLKNNGGHKRLYETHEWVFYPDGSLADYYGIVKRCIDHGIPGFIMEYGFMTNANDLKYFQNDANLMKMGKATAEAIAEKYNLKLRTQGSYDRSHQPIKTQSEYSLITDNIPRTMTFGDKPFTIPVKGGNGNGKITYEFDTLRVFKFEGDKIYIIGADDNVKVMSTKGTDGTYMPTTSKYSNFTISVKPKNISLSLSTEVNDGVIVKCKANDLVEGFLPKGNAAFYVNGVFLERKAFKEDGTCSIKLEDSKKSYDITVKYENVSKGEYVDYYNIPSVNIKYQYGTAPTVTATPFATPSPTPKPTSTTITTTPTPTPASTIGNTVEPAPSETVGSSPEVTPYVSATLTPGVEKDKDNTLDVYVILLIASVTVLIVVTGMYVKKLKKSK